MIYMREYTAQTFPSHLHPQNAQYSIDYLNSDGKGSEAGGDSCEIIMTSQQTPAFPCSSDKQLLVLNIQWVEPQW